MVKAIYSNTLEEGECITETTIASSGLNSLVLIT